MLVASFWLLLWRPRSNWSAALGGAFLAATALSTPGTIFFLPLALLRAFAVRDGRDLAIVGAYFGANLDPALRDRPQHLRRGRPGLDQ